MLSLVLQWATLVATVLGMGATIMTMWKHHHDISKDKRAERRATSTAAPVSTTTFPTTSNSTHPAPVASAQSDTAKQTSQDRLKKKREWVESARLMGSVLQHDDTIVVANYVRLSVFLFAFGIGLAVLAIYYDTKSIGFVLGVGLAWLIALWCFLYSFIVQFGIWRSHRKQWASLRDRGIEMSDQYDDTKL